MKSNIGITVVETESFIKQAAALRSAAELDELKDYFARNPLPVTRSPARAACESFGGDGPVWESEEGRE